MKTCSDDNLSAIIIDRLGERQRKIECMKEWDKSFSSGSRTLRYVYIVATVAACVLLVWTVFPAQDRNMEMLENLGITYSQTEFRAASQDMAEISDMIESKNYDDALVKTKNLLSRSDLVIDEFEDVGYLWDDEELMYSMKEELLANSELRWTYIYLLVCTGDRKEAQKQLKVYLKQKEYCEHEAEARKLLKELKKES